MPNLRAAFAAAMTVVCMLATGAVLLSAGSASAAWDKPWQSKDRALVIDAYEFNPIDWQSLTSDKRIAGFINKASDGLPPEWKCNGKSGDDELLCKNRWWKYSVTKELYMTRRAMAKTLGLKWGAYHLARPGNPREQADHFIDFAEPTEDDLIAIDIEDNTAEWMSLADAEIFANQIFIRTGRYPVLYTNGSTAKWISDYKETYPLLSRLPLWYARYRDDITGLFPETTWPSYALWQFSSMHNCSQKQCPYRVKGAKSDIDVNVASLDVEGLRAAWPFNNLVRPLDPPAPTSLVAEVRQKAEKAIGSLVADIALLTENRAVKTGAPTPREIAAAAEGEPLVAAYGPADQSRPHIDPLQLLTATAEAERRDGAAKVLADAAATSATAEPAARRLLSPGQSVKVASLGAFEPLGAAMRDVAAIVPSAAKAVPVAMPAVTAFGENEKSKFRQWLRQANDDIEVSRSLVHPAAALSGERGPRLVRKAVPAARAVEWRIAGAFLATR